MSDLYRGYAVDGRELGVVEVGLHIGFLNAALAGRLSEWANPESSGPGERHVSESAFDCADDMVRRFRSRTRGGKTTRYYVVADVDQDEDRNWIEANRERHGQSARTLEKMLEHGGDGHTLAEIMSMVGYVNPRLVPLLDARMVLSDDNYSPWPREGDSTDAGGATS